MLRAEAVFVVGEKITPFVSPWSTMTNMKSNPEEGGRSVMRSQETCWNGRVAVEGRGRRVGVHLVLLANCTTFNILADKGSKSRPPKFSRNELASF